MDQPVKTPHDPDAATLRELAEIGASLMQDTTHAKETTHLAYFETMQTSIAKVVELATEYRDGDQQARSFTNPDLNFVALDQQRGQLRQQNREKIMGEFVQLRNAVTVTTEKMSATYSKVRPGIDTNSPAAMINAEQIWNHNIRPLLDAGGTLKQILKTADYEALPIIERFGQAYLNVLAATKPGHQYDPLELGPDQLSRAIDNRLAITAPPADRQTIEDSVLAQAAAERFNELAHTFDSALAGRVDLATAALNITGTASISYGESPSE